MSGDNTRDGAGSALRVLLVEDHAAIRQPMAFMFEREPDMTVGAGSGTLAEARDALEKTGVDVAVLDIDLPDGKGTDFITATCTPATPTPRR